LTLDLAFILLVVAGVVVAVISLLVLRSTAARPGTARRLAGPPEVKVGTLLDAGDLPKRPVRLVGRIRCQDPLEAGGGERLVAFHRDVEVHIGRRWRTIERLRESRSFELWDHDGSLTVDPVEIAEPIIAIPEVWRGAPAELEEPHASAVARLVEREGPATEARAITRSINVTDRLLVLARTIRDPDGTTRLEPPDGGYLVSTVALDDAMRLLAGPHRRAAASGVIGLGVAIALLAIGGIGALITAFVGT
jgi:hypothetical protein